MYFCCKNKCIKVTKIFQFILILYNNYVIYIHVIYNHVRITGDSLFFDKNYLM